MLSGGVFDANPIPVIYNFEIVGRLMAVMYPLKQCLHGLQQGARCIYYLVALDSCFQEAYSTPILFLLYTILKSWDGLWLLSVVLFFCADLNGLGG